MVIGRLLEGEHSEIKCRQSGEETLHRPPCQVEVFRWTCLSPLSLASCFLPPKFSRQTDRPLTKGPMSPRRPFAAAERKIKEGTSKAVTCVFFASTTASVSSCSKAAHQSAKSNSGCPPYLSSASSRQPTARQRNAAHLGLSLPPQLFRIALVTHLEQWSRRSQTTRHSLLPLPVSNTISQPSYPLKQQSTPESADAAPC